MGQNFVKLRDSQARSAYADNQIGPSFACMDVCNLIKNKQIRQNKMKKPNLQLKGEFLWQQQQ